MPVFFVITRLNNIISIREAIPNFCTDKEVRSDVIALGEFVAVVNLSTSVIACAILLLIFIEPINVELNNVLCVGILLINRVATERATDFIILAIADIVDVAFVDKRRIAENVVHNLSVGLVFERCVNLCFVVSD